MIPIRKELSQKRLREDLINRKKGSTSNREMSVRNLSFSATKILSTKTCNDPIYIVAFLLH